MKSQNRTSWNQRFARAAYLREIFEVLARPALFGTLGVGLLCGLHASLLAEESLYRRMGGRELLKPMVSDFVDMVTEDPKLRINSVAKKYLDAADPADIKNKLLETVCEASGGPCKAPAARASLRAGLLSMDLTPADWNELMSDFSASLSKFKVAAPEQAEFRVFMGRVKKGAAIE